jgi:hypothetical protein
VSPVRFIAAVGQAYRASGRAAPLMDAVDIHAYAGKNSWSLVRPRRWPNAGAADLDRLKQAFRDAFRGTSQPLFAEAEEPGIMRTVRTLRFRLDETATQVKIDPARVDPGLYTGKENIPTVDEATQARYYKLLIRRVRCDEAIAALVFFHLIDEPSLRGFQSGLLRRDHSLRPAFASVRRAIGAKKGCPAQEGWRPATRVIGARTIFNVSPRGAHVRIFGLTATAHEDANAKAGIFPAGESVPRFADLRRALSTTASEDAPLSPLLSAQRLIRAHRAPRLEFRGVLPPGRYVYAVRLRAVFNPGRSSLFRSRVFEIR